MITVGKLSTLLNDAELTISFDKDHQFRCNSDDKLMLAPFLSYVVEAVDAISPNHFRIDILMEPGHPVSASEMFE